MKVLVKVGRAVFRVFMALIKAMGGFENAVRMATIALALLVGVRVLNFLGHLGFTCVVRR